MTTRVKIFTSSATFAEDMEKKINEFIKGREVVDVKVAASDRTVIYCVIYKAIVVD